MCIRDRYTGDPLINIVIMLLIIVGGIGFMTWDDIYINKWKLKRYRMQSKVDVYKRQVWDTGNQHE